MLLVMIKSSSAFIYLKITIPYFFPTKSTIVHAKGNSGFTLSPSHQTLYGMFTPLKSLWMNSFEDSHLTVMITSSAQNFIKHSFPMWPLSLQHSRKVCCLTMQERQSIRRRTWLSSILRYVLLASYMHFHSGLSLFSSSNVGFMLQQSFVREVWLVN